MSKEDAGEARLRDFSMPSKGSDVTHNPKEEG